MSDCVIRTSRLIMRQWRDEDLPAFAALNGDPRVMEFFPATMSREESDIATVRIRDNMQRRGFGLWAVEIAGGAPFIGFVGLNIPRFESHFTPCVEIGWRLAFDFWGKGYASEAARGALRFGFETLKLEEIVAFTAVSNKRSQAVMRRIGMTRDAAGDFDHPIVAEGHPLRRHVLYRVRAEGYTF